LFISETFWSTIRKSAASKNAIIHQNLIKMSIWNAVYTFFQSGKTKRGSQVASRRRMIPTIGNTGRSKPNAGSIPYQRQMLVWCNHCYSLGWWWPNYGPRATSSLLTSLIQPAKYLHIFSDANLQEITKV